MGTHCATNYGFPSQSVSNITFPGPSLESLCSGAEFICFMAILEKAIRNNPKISRSAERFEQLDEPDEEYDFIVVGAGAGGATVAGRLAEVQKWKTILLEAGDDESPAGQIPSFYRTLAGSEIDWHYKTSNEKHACLSRNGSCSWASAKSLGGNTAHHGMVYLRGCPKDYDYWASLGNRGWGYNEVLEVYKEQEDNADIEEVGCKYHGKGGPLSVGKFPYVSRLAKTFLKASEQSGIGVNEDLNGENLTGFSITQATNDHGVRVSSATAFLRPQRKNGNLAISLKSHVTKIIIENNVAVGVEYVKDGEVKSVRAKREVIISAGTVKSPQLLLLSGIGPEKQIESKGIEVVHDLPGVGENLNDHVGMALQFTINRTDFYENNEVVAKEYLEHQTGLMSATGGSYILGKVYSNRSNSDCPDLQLQVDCDLASCAPGPVGAKRSNGRYLVKITVVNVQTKSRGRISLATKNPLDHPIMWGNYLSDPIDVDAIVDGIEIVLKLIETDALKAYDFTLDHKPLEACSNHCFLSREYWTCAVHQQSNSYLHQAGTCKMGPSSDPMAVVDPRLRVHGIKNLRVADASIMPKVTSANTAAPTMMIGEQAANFIKNFWLPSKNQLQCHKS